METHHNRNNEVILAFPLYSCMLHRIGYTI